MSLSLTRTDEREIAQGHKFYQTLPDEELEGDEVRGSQGPIFTVVHSRNSEIGPILIHCCAL